LFFIVFILSEIRKLREDTAQLTGEREEECEKVSHKWLLGVGALAPT
jgi:hypothetical protein